MFVDAEALGDIDSSVSFGDAGSASALRHGEGGLAWRRLRAACREGDRNCEDSPAGAGAIAAGAGVAARIESMHAPIRLSTVRGPGGSEPRVKDGRRLKDMLRRLFGAAVPGAPACISIFWRLP